MKLPNQYKSWPDFALTCSSKFPNAKTVRVLENNTDTEFPVETIKANAFDEIANKKFRVSTVLEIKRIISENRTQFVNQYDAKSIFDLLFLLADKN